MVILPENAHLHHVKAEVEDMVYGVIAEDVEDVVEDEEGDVQGWSPRTNSCHVGTIGASRACT